jgi:ligand-binding sensor domain-containing protein
MSNNPITKRVFGKRGFFWFALLVAVYLLIVAIEEAIDIKLQGEWITYTTKNSPLLDNNIHALTTDDKGQLWIGTKKGLYVIAPEGSWTTYTKENTTLLSDEI